MLATNWYFLVIVLLMIHKLSAKSPGGWNLPYMEMYHDPEMFDDEPSQYVNGSEIPSGDLTPDWRLREPPWYAYRASYLYMEKERPYRISPHKKQTYKWSKVHRWFIESGNLDDPVKLGCYCTTVFRRYTVLAGCALLTSRHILTTATSTELVIRDRRGWNTMAGWLGLWYDNDLKTDNSSMYAEPARIHYHPKVSFRITYGSTVPQGHDIVIVVGFQYIRSLRKRPQPWYKYAVRTQKWLVPCPQKNWGWFHCLEGGHWAEYGVESGAAWHRATHGYSWLQDGLAGMCAFSLRLRSDDIVHYFTVINTYPVLDFLYDAYMGRLPYEYLDYRFYDTSWGPPLSKPWFYIYTTYSHGEENYEAYGFEIPFYKK